MGNRTSSRQEAEQKAKVVSSFIGSPIFTLHSSLTNCVSVVCITDSAFCCGCLSRHTHIRLRDATPVSAANKMPFLAGVELEKVDKSKIEASQAIAGKVVALYFSAHWCPPCRQFTPILKDFYGEVEDDLEVIFISLDRSEADLKDYMKEAHGDWYHIPFGSDTIKALSAEYGVSGIPALIIVKNDGTVISKDGRSDVQGGKNPKAVITKWKSA